MEPVLNLLLWKAAQLSARFITRSVSNAVSAEKELMESFSKKMESHTAQRILR